MMKRFGIGRATTISTCIGVFMVIFVLSTGVGWAQDKATAYPAGLDDPSIELEELQLRLIPLDRRSARFARRGLAGTGARGRAGDRRQKP
jgi:hypothetical protein